MDSEQFRENIIIPLYASSNIGDAINEAGTRLIGHTPAVAPKAFTHIVYAPIEAQDLQELKQRVGKEIPEELESFLKLANGMIVFHGHIRVFGYEPLKRRLESGIHNYPPSMSIPNTSVKIRGSNEGSFIVGWYKTDGSYVSIESEGNVLRFEPRDNGKVIQSWPSYYAWLISEIVNHNKLKGT